MSEEGTVILSPKVGSKLVGANVTAYYHEGKDERGRKQRADIGKYKDERWLDSFQTKGVPEFSFNKKQFELIKEDGSMWSQADAEAACKELKLRYEKGMKNVAANKIGEVITSCNIKDQADPFFNHSWWREKKAREGEMKINLSEPGIGPIVDAIRGSEFVSTARKGEATSGKVRELLSNVKADAQYASEQVDEEMGVFKLFDTMGVEKRRMIFRALGNFDEGVEDNQIKKDLFTRYVKDDATLEEGVTRQQLFKSLALLKPQELLVRELTMTGIRKGVIRQRSGVYEYAGGAVGTNMTAVYDFFLSGVNNQQLSNLHLAVKGTPLSVSETAVNKLVAEEEVPVEPVVKDSGVKKVK